MTNPLMEPETWALIGPAAVAIFLALGTIYQFFSWIVPRFRKLGHLVDDLTGEPARPGQAARPGLMERVQKLEDRSVELLHNSGSSIKDTVNRIDDRVRTIDVRLGDVETQIIDLREER